MNASPYAASNNPGQLAVNIGRTFGEKMGTPYLFTQSFIRLKKVNGKTLKLRKIALST